VSDSGVLVVAVLALACGWAVGRSSALHSRLVIINVSSDDDDDDDLPDFGFPIRSDPDMARMN